MSIPASALKGHKFLIEIYGNFFLCVFVKKECTKVKGDARMETDSCLWQPCLWYKKLYINQQNIKGKFQFKGNERSSLNWLISHRGVLDRDGRDGREKQNTTTTVVVVKNKTRKSRPIQECLHSLASSSDG